MQHPREHAHGSSSDRTVAVAGPWIATARTADHDVAAVASGRTEPGQQVARRDQVRQHDVVEGMAKLVRRLIEQPAALTTRSQGGDHAGEGTVEALQLRHQLGGPRIVGNGAGQDLQRGARMTAAQFFQRLRVAGYGDHRPARADGGLDRAATDRAGRAQDQNGGLHCPAPGTFSPTFGTMAWARARCCNQLATGNRTMARGSPTTTASTPAIIQASGAPAKIACFIAITAKPSTPAKAASMVRT